MKLTPQQKNVFSRWLQSQADLHAIKIDNLRENPDKNIKKDIMYHNYMINSLMTVKEIL